MSLTSGLSPAVLLPAVMLLACAAPEACTADPATDAGGRSGGDRAAHALDAAPAITRLTTDGYFKQRPAWSPDGARLVFARHRQETIWLYELEIATGMERRITQHEPPQ